MMMRPSARPEPKTVVAVDNSAEILEILKALLGDAGYRFFAAHSAKECFKLLAEMHPDLILLDVQMPEIGGFELCRSIRAIEAWRRIPILFLTARRTADDVKTGMAAGGNDFLTKPFDVKLLLARIERWAPLRS